MSVDRNLSVGWYCILDKSINFHDANDELGKENPQWRDFIVGTDPMLGQYNHICVFNTKDSRLVDDEDYVAFEFPTQMPPLSEKAERFVDAFREKYGDSSIRVVCGLVNWYS